MSDRLRDCLELAAKFYRDRLLATSRAMDYLASRGVDGDVAARYRLGYAPAEFQALQAVFPAYGTVEQQHSGLVVSNETGRCYDRFRDRIMFPILDEAGYVIGFGGRALDAEGPKYLNSPETPVFQKGHVLYGLSQAHAAIVATGTVYVVEGYLDVISLAQHGVENTVAVLGTATTSHHVGLLLSIANQVVFCFDGDDAGRRAAARALEACLPHVTDRSWISFLFLPRGHDPDSLVRAEGVDSFRALATEAASLEGFFLANAIQGHSLEYAEGRARLVSVAMPGLKQISAAPALLRRLLNTLALYTRFTVGELIQLGEIKLK